MARIRLDNNIGVPSARRPGIGPSPEQGNLIEAQAFQELGQVAFEFAQGHLIKKAKTYAAKSATTFKNEAIAAFEQSKRLKDVTDIEGFTPEFIKSLDAVGQKYLENAPSDLSRELLSQQFDVIKSAFFEKALEFENATITANSLADVDDIINMSGNGLLVAPEEFNDSLGTTLASIEAVSDLMTEEETRRTVERAQNTLAVSAVRGHISNDPKIALAQLKAGEWDGFLTPEQKNALMKLADDGTKTSNSVLAFELQRRIEADLAQTHELGYGNGLTREMVKGTYMSAGMEEGRAEVEARKYEIDKQVANKAYSFGQQIAFASPEDRQNVVAGLKPEAGSRTFDLDQKVFEAAEKRRIEIEQVLEEDPMAYVMTNDRVKEAFDPELGGSVQKGLSNALTLQARMLNPNYQALLDEGKSVGEIIQQTEGLRILSDREAGDLVNRLNTSDPNEIFGILGDIRGAYSGILGNDFVYNKALNELANNGLNGGIAFAINAAEFQAPGTVELIAAINEPMNELKTALGEQNVPFEDIQTQVQSELADVRQAFIAGDPSQLSYWNEIEQALTKMAARRIAAGQEESESDAAEYVRQNVIDHMFAVGDNVLVPRVDADGMPVDTDKVLQHMSDIVGLNELPKVTSFIKSKGEFPGSTPEAKALRYQQLGSSGTFVNAPSGHGYYLQITDAGVPVYLLDKAGNPAVFKTHELLGLDVRPEERRTYRQVAGDLSKSPLSRVLEKAMEE